MHIAHGHGATRRLRAVMEPPIESHTILKLLPHFRCSDCASGQFCGWLDGGALRIRQQVPGGIDPECVKVSLGRRPKTVKAIEYDGAIDRIMTMDVCREDSKKGGGRIADVTQRVIVQYEIGGGVLCCRLTHFKCFEDRV